MAYYYVIPAGALVFLALLAGPLLFGRMFMPRLTLKAVKKFGKVVARVMDRIKPGLDLRLLVRAGNRYFADQFARTPFEHRSLFIPICLCPPLCPAEVDRDQGLVCRKDCPGCKVGELIQEAENLGYGRVFVVPSSTLMPQKGLMRSDRFIKTKIQDPEVWAALGMVCAWHLRNRLLPNHSVGSKGYDSDNGQKKGTVIQGVLLDRKKCRGANVDWDEVRFRMGQARA